MLTGSAQRFLSANDKTRLAHHQGGRGTLRQRAWTYHSYMKLVTSHPHDELDGPGQPREAGNNFMCSSFPYSRPSGDLWILPRQRPRALAQQFASVLYHVPLKFVTDAAARYAWWAGSSWVWPSP